MNHHKLTPWMWVILGLALLLLGIAIGLAVYNGWVIQDWPSHAGLGGIIVAVIGYALIAKGINMQEYGS